MKYDVVVIGGHAGSEAAGGISTGGAKTALIIPITHRLDT